MCGTPIAPQRALKEHKAGPVSEGSLEWHRKGGAVELAGWLGGGRGRGAEGGGLRFSEGGARFFPRYGAHELAVGWRWEVIITGEGGQ